MKELLTSLAATAAVSAAVLAPAPAQAATGLEYDVRVDPSDMSATAYVSDTFGSTFTATLAAMGAVTCGAVSPQSAVAASDQQVGNPVHLSTPGTCTPYNGEVTYDLTWVSIGGTSGHHTVVCVAHLATVTCSLPGLQFYA